MKIGAMLKKLVWNNAIGKSEMLSHRTPVNGSAVPIANASTVDMTNALQDQTVLANLARICNRILS